MNAISMSTSAAVPVTGCLQLCLTLIDQLSIAKHNKKECSSLKTLIESVQDFLEDLPADGLSPAANNILKRMAQALESSQGFLGKMTRMGPLMSLLLAREVRQDLLRFNRDLSSLFSTMASGEKLVYLNIQRLQALRSVQAELRASSVLFTDKEMLAGQLLDIASTAQHQNMHPEQLHMLLMHQLEAEDEITGLTPEELLNELYALQLEEMYTDNQDNQTTGKPKPLGSKTEDFLVEQICAAYAPKAARAGKPLTPAAATQPPAELLCPISGEVMSNPVMLVATGQTYDSMHIQRWLQQSNKCPVTGQELSSKQLAPNYVVKSLIQEWARQNGVRLRDPGSQVLGSSNHSGILKSAQAVPSSSVDLVVGLDAAEQGRATAAGNTAMHGLLPTVLTADGAGTQQEAVGTSKRWRCTRTSWAIALTLLVLGVTVALGVGIPLATKRKVPGQISSPNPPNSTGNSPSPRIVPGQISSPSPPNATVNSSSPTIPGNSSNAGDPQLESLLLLKAAVDEIAVLRDWTRAAGVDGGYCEWPEVDCRDNTKQVYRITMNTNTNITGLQGTLPSYEALAGLTSLTTLDIAGQPDVSGTIPEDWSKLEQLQNIRLANNSLTGTIPASFKDLQQLRVLYLFDNKLTGTVPAWLGDISSLVGLSLTNNGFLGTLPASLSMLQSLQTLRIGSNRLSGTLPEFLGDMTSLTDLRLFGNRFTGQIPSNYGQLRNLQGLSLSANDLSGAVPASFSQLRSLTKLYLWGNQQLTGCLPLSASQLVDVNVTKNVFAKTQIEGEC